MTAAKRFGFTLVELLVVMGVVVLLIAILLPALSKAREQANRVKCGANLHNWGQAAHIFATEQRGIFPMGFRNLNNNSKWPHAMRLESEGPWGTKDPNYFTAYAPTLEEFTARFGATWEQWARYGMPDKSLRCPSALLGGGFISDTDGNWGGWVDTQYVYVGGYAPENVMPGLANWGKLAPARRQNDKDTANGVLAMDMVYWGGIGINDYRINHISNGNVTKPAYQNILYADGHVDGQGSNYFASPLSTTNWSLSHYFTPWNGYFYWGIKEAGPIVSTGPYH